CVIRAETGAGCNRHPLHLERPARAALATERGGDIAATAVEFPFGRLPVEFGNLFDRNRAHRSILRTPRTRINPRLSADRASSPTRAGRASACSNSSPGPPRAGPTCGAGLHR